MLNELLKALPRKRLELAAKLSGVSGFTGRGDIEFTVWKSGARELEVELRGVAGRIAEVYADNVLIATVNLNNGRVGHRFDTRKGDDVPALVEGERIEVRQNGDVILDGVLIPD